MPKTQQPLRLAEDLTIRERHIIVNLVQFMRERPDGFFTNLLRLMPLIRKHKLPPAIETGVLAFLFAYLPAVSARKGFSPNLPRLLRQAERSVRKTEMEAVK